MPGILMLLIAASAAHNQPADKTGPEQWVQVTKPVMSCAARKNEPAIDRRLADAMAAAKPTPGCRPLRVGQKLRLDARPRTESAERLLAPTGGKGSAMAVVYGPSRKIAGDYFAPTTPPQG